jgi:hypothetical protein
MAAHNSRNASNSRNVSNNRSANTTHAVWAQSKAGMLAKTVKPATAWREANCCRDLGHITSSTAEGRPATSRMPEKRLTNNSNSISRDANSTMWCEERRKTDKIPHFLSGRFQ